MKNLAPTGAGRNAAPGVRHTLSRNDIERLRTRLSDPVKVARVLGLLMGARVRPSGCTIHCPFHEDATPSCSLFVGDDGALRFHCFGCSAGGDIFDFVARGLRLDRRRQFRDILRAAKDVALEIERTHGPTDASPAAERAPRDEAAFARVVKAFLSRALSDERDVGQYVEHRGLFDEAVRDGWAALPVPGAQGRIIAALGHDERIRSWLLTEYRGLVWPEHRLVVPWRDPAGNVVMIQRRLARAPDAREPKYVTLRGARLPWPYGIERLASAPSAPIAIVEGAFDVLALRALNERFGVNRAVIGIPGVASWRSEWADIIRGREVVIALDNDAAGDGAVERLARQVRAAGATRVQRAAPQSAKDWNEALLQTGGAVDG